MGKKQGKLVLGRETVAQLQHALLDNVMGGQAAGVTTVIRTRMAGVCSVAVCDPTKGMQCPSANCGNK
jgi:hypothetical protein